LSDLPLELSEEKLRNLLNTALVTSKARILSKKYDIYIPRNPDYVAPVVVVEEKVKEK